MMILSAFERGFLEKLAKTRDRVEVLLHSPDKKKVLFSNSEYDFPGGGVENGESKIGAGNREALEEVGITSMDLKNIPVQATGTFVKNVGDFKKGDKIKTNFLFGEANIKDKSQHGADKGYKMPVQFTDINKVLDKLKKKSDEDNLKNWRKTEIKGRRRALAKLKELLRGR